MQDSSGSPPSGAEQGSPNVVAVIPVRYASTRFPGKPLAQLAGKPMIQHVYERVCDARKVGRVLVATDDERILKVIADLGGNALMTRPDHRSGTERVAEVASQVSAKFYVNVQGDEPLIDPAAIDVAVEALEADEAAQVGTLCASISRAEDLIDPNVVKVVIDFEGNALYFSRAPIPWVREHVGAGRRPHAKHIGLYAYRRDALLEFPTLPPGELERIEQLEQLRWLENGYKIRVVETSYESVSVDVPEDLARVEKLLREVDASEGN